MATEYLRAVVDNEWTNQMVFGQHPTVSRSNRDGRVFMRAEPMEADERFRNQERTVRIAELLFNLQNVEGIDARLEDLRLGRVESTFAELEAGAFLRRRAVSFRYINPSGTKGADYDAEIPLHETSKVNCEMKCNSFASKAMMRKSNSLVLKGKSKQKRRGSSLNVVRSIVAMQRLH